MLSVVLGSWARAQTLETLFSFPNLQGGPNETMIRGSDGNFYGTAPNGGANNSYGVVFKMTPSGEVTVLHSFEIGTPSSQGEHPTGSLVEVGDGVFYGLTSAGGTNGYGTAFKITRTGDFTALHSFGFATGRTPNRGLVLADDGNLYGVAQQGGTNDRGTIFRLTPAGQVTVPYNFGASGPGIPFARLVRGPDGALYGSEISGNSIFRITTAGAYSTVAVLTNAQGNSLDNALAVGSDGNFYGAAVGGGSAAPGHGTIFKLTPAGAVTVLHVFTGTDGDSPVTGLALGPDGNFYGTTRFGGASSSGTLFRITPTGAFSLLRSFGSTSSSTLSGLVVHNGLLYGIAAGFAGFTEAVFYSLTTAGVVSTLAPFDRQNRGAFPKTGMIQASDGNFYGCTDGNGGVLYRLTPSGVLTVLVRFTGTNGSNPEGSLVQGSDGNLYGVTRGGGANSRGTIFRLTLAGQHTVLYNIAGSGSFFLWGGLVQGDDGNFYGALYQNGTGSNGAIYRLTPQGVFSIAHDFTPAAFATEGGNPSGPLLKLPDGNFIGSTDSGAGGDGEGAIFRMTPQGAVTVLTRLSFSAHRVQGGFVLGPGGNFYGAVQYGGVGSTGALISCTPAGVLSTVANFSGANGQTPLAAPILGPDGNFIGTTSAGNPSPGVVYRITPAGAETVLHSFSVGEGDAPNAPLILGSDGALYGSTSENGTGGGGTLFRIFIAPIVTTQPATNAVSTSATLNATVNPNGTATTAVFEYGPNTNYGATTTTQNVGAGGTAVAVTQAISGLTPHALYHYRVSASNPNGTSLGSDATFTLANTPPTAPNGTATGLSGTQKTVAIAFPATDADGDAVSITSATGSANLVVNTFTATTVTFTPASNFAGDATFTYTVSDGLGGTATGTITVTVSLNPPPAGGTFAIMPNTGVRQGDALNLTAAGWTDPDVPLTYQFFLGASALNAAGSASTLNISAPAAGSYSLKVRVTDAAGSFTDTTQPLTVVAFTPIESWRYANFNSYANTGNAADSADWDHDGVLNLMEFAFGTNPTSGASGSGALQYTGTFAGAGTLASAGQPIARFESIPNGVDFRALFVRRVDYLAAGLTYTPEFSADMAAWQPGNATPAVLTDNGTLQVVSVPYPVFVGGKKALYFRVQVSIAP